MKSSDRHEERAQAEVTLATVDAALEGGSAREGSERDRELGQLALALRGGAPRAREGFGAELEERVAEGFGDQSSRSSRRHRRTRSRPGRSARRRPRLVGPAAAGAVATAVLALVAAAGVLTSGGAGPSDGGSPRGGGSAIAPETAAPRDEPAIDALSSDSAAPPTGQSAPASPSSGDSPGFAPGQAQRRIERAASLTVATPEDRVDTVSQGIVAATERHRGYLVSSSTFSGDDAPAGGSFDLRVPVDELRATLSDLAALGTVRAQSQTGEDLTEPVATTADRLDGARADRRGLLRRLERADSDRQARALRRQLELVSGEIRGLRSQLEALEERTDFARVAVTLVDESSSGSATTPSSTESALHDALGSLVGAFNLVIRGLGVLIPFALVVALAWLVLAALRRRRRESILG